MKAEFTAEEQAARKQFTKDKLEWINCLILDRRLTDAQKVYGVYIALRINWRTGITYVSDETAGDEAGLSRGSVQTARKRLVKLRWLDVSRLNLGSPYTFRLNSQNINAMLDIRQANRDLRIERKKQRQYRQHAEGLTVLKAPQKMSTLMQKAS